MVVGLDRLHGGCHDDAAGITARCGGLERIAVVLFLEIAVISDSSSGVEFIEQGGARWNIEFQHLLLGQLF